MDVSNRQILALTPEEYFARPEVSSGGIRTFAKEGPLMYWARYVARILPDTDSEARTLGKAFHKAMEDRGAWMNYVSVVPKHVPGDDLICDEVNAKLSREKSKAQLLVPGEPINAQLKSHRLYLEEFKLRASLAGHTVISSEQYDALIRMIDSVYESPAAVDILEERQGSELACVGTCDVTGLGVKALLDMLGDDRIVDFKTTRQSTANGWLYEAFKQLGYQYQAAHYMRTAGKRRFTFITVRNEVPWETMVYTLTWDELADRSPGNRFVSNVGGDMRSVVDANVYQMLSIRDCVNTNSWHSLYWGSEIDNLSDPGRLMQ